MRTCPLFLPFLVLFLSPSFSVFAQPEVREIKVIAVVSPEFKKNLDWENEIRDRILFANQVFEKDYAVRFSIKNFQAWEPQDEAREMGLLIEELRSLRTLGSNEVILGFHRMSRPFGGDTVEDVEKVGTAFFFRGYGVLRDPYNELEPVCRRVILAHEMAHLFGAVHISEPNQIMGPAVPRNPALKLDPDNGEIIDLTRTVDFQKGVDSLSQETIQGLANIYERLIRKNPRGDFYYQLGHFYERLNQPAKAVSIWEEAIRYHYDNPSIHRELGFHYYKSGRYELAIRELGSAIAHFVLPSQQKDRAMTLNFLGAAYYEKGNLEQAIFTWLKGLSADPDSRDLQGNLAAAYLQNGDLDRAVNGLERLNAKYPGDAATLSNLGVAYLKKKEFSKSVDYFQQALEKGLKAGVNHGKGQGKLMQDMPESMLRMNLGAAYLETGDLRKAVRELEKSKALDADHFEIHLNLAQAYAKSKAYDKVIKEIEEGFRYRKDEPYLYTFLAQAYSETGRVREAVEAAKRAIQYASGDLKAALYKNLGMLYARQGQYTQAIVELRNSLNQNWKDPQAHTWLGFVYLDAGRTTDARRSFETALHLDPQYEEAEKALDALPQGNK